MTSKLSEFQEILSSFGVMVKLYTSIGNVLTEHDDLIYRLSEDNRRLVAAVREADVKIKSLEKRYSELLYQLPTLK